LIALVVTWALRPVGPAGISVKPLRPSAPPASIEIPTVAPIDVAAFDVVLWNPVVVEVPAANEVPPEADRVVGRLGLIGIVTENGAHRAIVYDTDSDRLHEVEAGDRLGVHSIGSIAERFVEIHDGHHVRLLTLEPSGKDPS
jgi:hypothetical protein